jgi:hypothetical protein
MKKPAGSAPAGFLFTGMTPERKELYRDLLGWAMVDMRVHSANSTTMVRSLLGRRRNHREVLHFIYAMTTWLHNTALYSATDFDGFNEDWFWDGYSNFRRKFPAAKWAPHTEAVIKELQDKEMLPTIIRAPFIV